MNDEHDVERYDGATQSDRMMAMLCHLAGLPAFAFYGLIAVIVIWCLKKEESPFIDDQGKEALNFQISMIIYTFIFGALSTPFTLFVGVPFVFALVIADIVLPIIAAVKSNDGVFYRYPMILRFV